MLHHLRRRRHLPILSTPTPHHFWLNPWTADTVECVIRDARAAALTPLVIDADQPHKSVHTAGIATHPQPRELLRHLYTRTDSTEPIVLLVGERHDLDEDALRLLSALPRLGRTFNVRLGLDIALADRVDIFCPLVCERITGVLFAQPTLVEIPVTAVRPTASTPAAVSTRR